MFRRRSTNVVIQWLVGDSILNTGGVESLTSFVTTKRNKSFLTYKAERSPYDPEPIPLNSPVAYALATRSM